MEIVIREAQKEIIRLFSKKTKTFALSGGSALGLYYLRHRFSVDLDFFSPRYSFNEIDILVNEFKKYINKIKLEAELISANNARVRFYSVPVKGTKRSLKIDFIEDVFFSKPKIERFDKVPVYNVEHIYYQKIAAASGTSWKEDITGRQILEGGRQEARDVFDIYMLSKKICPLHIFLGNMPRYLQRGIIQWYRSFSREEMKLGVLDLDIYDRQFDAKEMIVYLEKEIKEFIKEELK